MIDGQNFFYQPIKNNLITYDNTRKIGTGQGDDYTTSCFLDCTYFKNYYKMIATDALDVDSKAIQQTNFTANLNEPGNTAIFFIIEEAKETILDFSQRTVEVL